MVKPWSGRGLRAVVYIADGIVAVKGGDKAIRESLQVRRELL